MKLAASISWPWIRIAQGARLVIHPVGQIGTAHVTSNELSVS
jgi:hypothetical protein